MPPASAAAPLRPEVVARLAEAARWAPSPDNNQPWALQPRSSEIVLWHVCERAIASDECDMFRDLALGAVVENIRIAATADGLVTLVTWLPFPWQVENGRERAAVLTFTRGAVPDPLLPCLQKRRTNRKSYRREAPPERDLAEIAAAAGKRNASLQWTTDRTGIDEIARVVGPFDRIRFEHRPFHQELFHCMRFSAREARETRDGLYLKTLEIPALAAPLLRRLGNWRHMQSFNRMGGSRLLAGMSVFQARNSGALGLLAADGKRPSAFLDAGSGLQRAWIEAAARDLEMQPLGSLPLFLANRTRNEGATGPLPDELVLRASRALERTFRPPPGSRPAMLVRLGRASAPSTRSERYGLDGILLDGCD